MESVTIVDNTEAEVIGLKKALDSKKVLYDVYHPKMFKPKRFKLKNRKLIFLDLYLNDALTTSTEQISSIRHDFKQIVGKNFGVYGIVLWTKHIEEIDQFKEKIALDHDLYTLPLFVVGLDKSKYLREGFGEIFKDIENILSANTAASFFVRWNNAIEKGKANTISEIFSLVKDYKFQDNNLKFLLYHLAKNKTGIHHDDITDYPLHIDAYQAFSELLIYDISSQIKSDECQLFNNMEQVHYLQKGVYEFKKNYKNEYFKDNISVNIEELQKQEIQLKNRIKIIKEECESPRKEERVTELNLQKKEVTDECKLFNTFNQEINSHFSLLNTKMLLDEDMKSVKIFPGNIYEIIDMKSLLRSEKMNTTDIPIVIEMTPPCDFANGKKAAQKVKMLGGFITDYSEGRKESLRGDSIYTEPHPLKLKAFSKEKMIVFDFRYLGVLDEKDLENKKKHKLLYRAKDNLFADILQKMSAQCFCHLRRNGIAYLTSDFFGSFFKKDIVFRKGLQ
jgi:hypothetical protein